MREELVKLWIAECEKMVAASLPSFQTYPSRPFVGPGRLYFDRVAAPTFFLLFQASEKRDAFTVEMAWNFAETLPQSPGYNIPRDWPDIAVIRTDKGVSEFRFRLCKLWAKPKYDPWWEFITPSRSTKSAELSVVADQSLDWQGKCAQLVTDAAEKIRTYGVPYMMEIRQCAHTYTKSLMENQS